MKTLTPPHQEPGVLGGLKPTEWTSRGFIMSKSRTLWKGAVPVVLLGGAARAQHPARSSVRPLSQGGPSHCSGLLYCGIVTLVLAVGSQVGGSTFA